MNCGDCCGGGCGPCGGGELRFAKGKVTLTQNGNCVGGACGDGGGDNCGSDCGSGNSCGSACDTACCQSSCCGDACGDTKGAGILKRTPNNCAPGTDCSPDRVELSRESDVPGTAQLVSMNEMVKERPLPESAKKYLRIGDSPDWGGLIKDVLSGKTSLKEALDFLKYLNEMNRESKNTLIDRKGAEALEA